MLGSPRDLGPLTSMITRTRSRTIPRFSRYADVAQNRCGGTPVYYSSGSIRRLILPYVSSYSRTDYGEVLPAELADDSESITDEVDAGARRIKFCEHVKRTSGGIIPRDTWLGSSQATAYENATSNKRFYHPTFMLINSTKGPDTAWRAMSTHGLTSMVSPNEASLLSRIGEPSDRLGSVPARLVSAIEEWHASTSLIEMRDLPSLANLFRRRGPVGLSVAALSKWLAARNDLLASYRMKNSFETIKKLCKAYREGQLGYAFGIMPTVGDVATVSRILSKGVKARSTRIIRTVKQDRSIATSPISKFVNRDVDTCELREYVSMLRVDGGCATLKRPRYSNPTFDNMVKRLLGVNGAQLIWEVLPGSFIVDWFMSLDDALDTIWLHNQTEYDVSFWSSTKLDYRREITGHDVQGVERPANQDGTAQLPYYVKWSEPTWCEHSHYKRVLREFPTPLSSMRFRLGPEQGFLTALIALGLIPNRSVKR